MAKKKAEQNEELEQLTATENFFETNKKFIYIGAGAILLIIVGIIGYQKLIKQPKMEESQDAYWNAFYAWENEDSTKVAFEGNENFMGFEEISSEYDGTPGGDIANYALAVDAMENGEFEVALDYLDETDFEDIMVGSLAIGLKGDCYVELGQLDEAVATFEEAAEREPNEFTTPLFLKKAGLVYEEMGDPEAAVKSYQKIKDNWSESTQATDIDKYIVRAQN